MKDRRRFSFLSLLVGLGLVLNSQKSLADAQVTVGSKAFTEGYVLAELISKTIESHSTELRVDRRFGMGGTGVLFEALKRGEISLYPEYTGTIAKEILKEPTLQGVSEIRSALIPLGFNISDSLGFNNTYALALRKEVAKKYQITKISDLKNASVPIRIAFSHEFMNRKDGYPGLERDYRLPKRSIHAVSHSLAYEAIGKGQIDLTDVYSTDAKIHKLNLVLLEDDRRFFPVYEAVILAREDWIRRFPDTWEHLRSLEGKLSQEEMIHLNGLVDLDKKSFSEVVTLFLGDRSQTHLNPLLKSQLKPLLKEPSLLVEIWRLTLEHLQLVLISTGVSIVIGIPLGLLAARIYGLGQGILLFSSFVQTIPSLALLCFLIPWFGIGMKPALVALILYGLLPIVLNTYTGIKSIDPALLEMSRALGLTPSQQIRKVELPLASVSILTGVKASAIIGIGTATLAALIGAGGYGVPIVAGLAINDIPTILKGAVPSAGMALCAHLFFEVLAVWIIPKGLHKSGIT